MFIAIRLNHQEFFRRDALQDRTAFALNIALLVILFYVDPLKFMFVAHGKGDHRRRARGPDGAQARSLFTIYGRVAWNRQDGTAQPFELVAIAPDLCVARHHQRCHRIASSSRLDLARNRHQRRYRFRDSRPPAFTAGSWLLAAMYRHAETQSDALDLNVIERLMTRTSFYDHAATGLFGLLSVALADTAIGLAGPIYFPRSFQRRPSGG